VQVVSAVVDEVGADRVGLRISPFGGFLDVSDVLTSSRNPSVLLSSLCLCIAVQECLTRIFLLKMG
jgi:hypothetical protein